MAKLAINLDYEERLLHVSAFQLVVFEEVFGNTHLLAVMSLEPHGDWGLSEINLLNNVGLLVAIGSDDSFVLEFLDDAALLISDVLRRHDLINSFQTSLI